MKVYVAGKWEDRAICRRLMNVLEGEGHEITCDWTDHKYEDEEYPQKYCQDDLDGVKKADCLVFCALEKRNYRGAFVEMGAALGLGKMIFVLGQNIDSCIFTHHPLVKTFRFPSDLMSELGKL